MNIPFTAMHFSVYEAAKKWLLGLESAEGEGEGEEEEGLAVQLVAGGLAGGAAAAVSRAARTLPGALLGPLPGAAMLGQLARSRARPGGAAGPAFQRADSRRPGAAADHHPAGCGQDEAADRRCLG
jgi:hypothetical protein